VITYNNLVGLLNHERYPNSIGKNS